MNWKKTTATAVLALVVLFCMTGCPKKAPVTPGAPWGADSTWTGASYVCHVTTTSGSGNVRYVMNWSDDTDTGDVSYASGETAAVTHIWNTVGSYDVKAQAILDAEPAKASEFSTAKSVKVLLNVAPVIDSVQAPPVAVKDAEAFFTVYGKDADGDSLRVIAKWPSGDTTTELFPTPCNATVSHIFTSIDPAAMVIFWTEDWKGTKSAPDTVLVQVGNEGGVKWYWWNDNENQGALSTSALVANDGTDEVVMSYCWDDYKFYSIKTSNGNDKSNVTTGFPEYEFSGHPGLCAATGHIIVGSDEGELYALTLDGLSKAWQWPDKSPEDSLDFIEWGAPAISATDIYIGRDDDNLYHFVDAGAQGNQMPTYSLDSASLVDAPVVDASGSVIFGTDSGYLIKIDGNLSSPFWRSHLEPIGEVHGPIIGGDGTIYCGTDSSRLYAVSPDSGVPKWTATLDGVGARPALGQSALFIGTENGKAYSVNPATGAINWEKPLAPGFGFLTTPIVAANGYVYFQSDDDVLYCVSQTDGTLIWSCDCKAYLPRIGGGKPHQPRKLELTGYDPNPSICANGNILVVGMEALYCVAGYELGPIDPAAAWPKWQKDLSNAGKK